MGQNSGSVSQSYSAMDLNTDGVNARAWGFCAAPGGRQGETFYLNNGNFSFRGVEFLANYDEQGGARPLSYIQLTAEGSPVPGLEKLPGTGGFPYPTGVTADGAAAHYGGWPRPLELGTMGVYYWEELRIPGKQPSYHVSLLAVDPGPSAGAPKTVSKISTLSTAHDEGGEVTRFGYGVYNQRGRGIKLGEKTPFPLLYSPRGRDGDGTAFSQQTFLELDARKDEAGSGLDRTVDDALAQLMAYELDEAGRTEFEFHSFPSYGQIPGQGGGLYPNGGPLAPNGTLTLQQGGNQDVTVTFALNPLFAGALAVQLPESGKWAAGKEVPLFSVQWNGALSGGVPGSENNPYGVRSIDQLQFIDWNSRYRNTSTVLGKEAKGLSIDTIDHFPYLSSGKSTGKYFWKQSYDVFGKADRQSVDTGYTPIAEYYDWDGGSTGSLLGWFGGTYDGGTYMIKDVYVTGQQSSCAGLFGVVYDGSLENIVLYSSDGQGKIATRANRAGSKTESRWFTMGGLAGVAGTSDPESNAIKNCSIAGYTILAEVYTYAAGSNDWGGGNIGGLVGSSHMNFSNCSAVTKVAVQNADLNDHLRVGGLAGSCQGTMRDCYAGGSIELNPQTVRLQAGKQLGVYVGGLVGGSYMKSLEVGEGTKIYIGAIGKGSVASKKAENDTNNTLQNCYSYVTLPPLSGENAHPDIKGLYAVGGVGELYPKEAPSSVNDPANHGICYMQNCYFLTSEVLANYGGSPEHYMEDLRQKRIGSKEPREPKTDLTDDCDLIPGKEYAMAGQSFTSAGSTSRATQLRDLKTNATIRVNSNKLYYRKGFSLSKGAGLFQYDGKTQPDGAWIYKFLGWLVDAGGTPWTYTTDPTYFNDRVTGLTYEQLARMQKGIPGKDPSKDIYDLLNEGKGPTDSQFQPVTPETEDGTPVPGKYSYPPADAPQLRDRDYPFPTILIKDGIYSVHYGGWPLKGFERRALDGDGTPLLDEQGQPVCLGGSPIETDLFVNAPHQEYLVLSGGVAGGGVWTLAWEGSQKEPLAAVKPPAPADPGQLPEGERDRTYLLHLTPLSNGTDDLLITYTAPDGVSYRLTVTVHITADVELRPSRLFLFPSDTVEIGIRTADKAGRPLALENGRLTLKGDPICGGTGFLEAKTLRAEATEDGPPAIRFTTSVPEDASGLSLDANANFVYAVSSENPEDPDQPLVTEYGGGSGGDIRVELIRLWEGQEDYARFETVTEKDGSKRIVCTITFPDHYQVGEEGALHFAQTTNRKPVVSPMLNPPEAAWATAEGSISLTLAYRAEVYEDLPGETTVLIPLTLTSGGEPEGGPKLIEGEQLHTLALTVKPPETETELPDTQGTEAPPPAGADEEPSARRRRARGTN